MKLLGHNDQEGDPELVLRPGRRRIADILGSRLLGNWWTLQLANRDGRGDNH